MLQRRERLISLAATLVLLGLNLVALNYLISGWSGARVDLTQDSVFSITPTTKRLLRSLDENLYIHGYFSKRTHPKLSPLVPEIVDLLDEYRAVSGGRVVVELLDPGQDEEAEAEAADRYGIQSTPFQLVSKYESGIVNAYFALVVSYGDQYERYGFQDLIEVDPMPDGDIDVRLRNLEYDLTRAIKKVVYGFRGSEELFERIGEPVRLTAIISPDSLPDVFDEVPDALRKAAQELAAKGAEGFVYEEIDPSLDPVLAQEVEQRYGARPMTLGFFGDESFYLYALLEVAGRLEQLVLTVETPTAAGFREAIEDSLKRHAPGFLKTIGVVTSDPPQIPPELRMQMQMPPQPPPEFEEIKRFLGQEYTVKTVTLEEDGGVDSDVDVLLVLKPKNLVPEQIYELDQYLMRGGRVVICSGSFQADFSAGGVSVSALDSGLEDWLAHHGVKIEKTLVLDDRNHALPVPETRHTPLGAIRTWALAPYPYLIQVRDEGFLNREVSATLDAIGIYWGSPVEVSRDAEAPEGEEAVEVLPLLQSSSVSWTDDDVTRTAYIDYSIPEEGTGHQLLAAALSGRFTSYFADRPAPGEEAPGEDGTDETSAAEPDSGGRPAPSVTLARSPETRLVVVGNGEFLSDLVARTLGQVDGGFFAENLRFVENLIDWVGLDNEMIAIRSRGLATRRTQRIDRGTEVTIEMMSYVLPTALLIALGSWLFWKRRHATAILRSARVDGAAGRSEV